MKFPQGTEIKASGGLMFGRFQERYSVMEEAPFSSPPPAEQENDNSSADRHQLWRGFKRLTEHPRFTNISGWMSLLEQVLRSPIPWYHAEEIVRVLERDPRYDHIF